MFQVTNVPDLLTAHAKKVFFFCTIRPPDFNTARITYSGRPNTAYYINMANGTLYMRKHTSTTWTELLLSRIEEDRLRSLNKFPCYCLFLGSAM